MTSAVTRKSGQGLSYGVRGPVRAQTRDARTGSAWRAGRLTTPGESDP